MRRRKPRSPGRPTKRNTSTFLNRGVDDINNEIVRAYKHVTKADKIWETYTKITKSDAESCFHKYNGRCVYCNKALTYLGRARTDAARLSFYVPLNVGGEARPDNLVVVCAQCKHNYRAVRVLRQDVTGIDTFADHCEALFIAVKEGASEETRNQIKNRLNLRLVDIATCMRYVTTGDWIPEEFEKVEENENTIGDKLEQLGRGEEVKNDITSTLKQIVTTKQYKIIRRSE